jgi:hypothetical protein
MMDRMKARVTLSVDESVAQYLTRAAQVVTGGNVSAFVEQLVRERQLAESVALHAGWYAARPDAAGDAEAERDVA